jgi:hypothetical protein
MPKPAVHEGTCGVCEQRYKVRDRKVVLHGYKRPGVGYIDGRCFGESMLAWEVSPQPVKLFLAEIVRPRHWALVQRLADFDAGRVTSLQRRVHKTTQTQAPTFETIKPDHPAWAVVFNAQWSAVAAELEHFTNLIARLEKRIEAWQPGVLVSVIHHDKHMRVIFAPVYGEWCVTSLRSGRLILRGRGLAHVLDAAAAKGWSLPPGAEIPVEMSHSDNQEDVRCSECGFDSLVCPPIEMIDTPQGRRLICAECQDRIEQASREKYGDEE